MASLVHHLAELTGQRDRERLDHVLAGALMEATRARAVRIQRCVGEADERHWVEGPSLGLDSPPARLILPGIDSIGPPLLRPGEARFEALVGQRVVAVPGHPHRTYFPLQGDTEAVGVAEIDSDAALDEAVEQTVYSLLRIFRNVEYLLDYGERDSLTGLFNRKTFDECFLKATAGLVAHADVSLERRRGECGVEGHWIGVIDIDHFKSVNDRFGHLIGDEVLLLLSRLMSRSFRLHDRLYRFGGEEFLVLMRCHGEAAALQALERLRSQAERFVFPQVGRVTVSIGFTAVRPGDTPSDAFERADKAVYHAKQNGRNQVCSHADLVKAGRLVESVKVDDVELF